MFEVMNSLNGVRTVKKALFVGASGKVGSLIRNSWSNRSHTELDLHFQYRRLSEITADSDVYIDPWANGLLDAPSCDLHYDAMFIFAGATSGLGLIDANAEISEVWLDFALSIGCEKVVLASSSAVYGAGRQLPFKEADIPSPSNDYGISKLKMENSLDPYRRLGLNICSLRIGNVLGADSLWRSIKSGSDGRPLKLDRFSDGQGPSRSYIEPLTLLGILENLSRLKGSELPQVLNVANPKATLMEDILNSTGVSWEWVPSSLEGLQNITLDCTLLEGLFDFSRVELDTASMVARVLELEGLV
jgi:UDP-glucose 4-epimerase